MTGVHRALDRDSRAGGDHADCGDHRGLGRQRPARRRGAPGNRSPRRDRGPARPAELDEGAYERQRDEQPDAGANGDSGAVDQLSDRARARPGGGGDLLVRAALERAAYQRLALGLR